MFDVVYDLSDNLITMKQRNHLEVLVYLVSGADLQIGKYWTHALPKDLIQSMDGVLRIGKESYLTQQGSPYIAYIDLHTTRISKQLESRKQ